LEKSPVWRKVRELLYWLRLFSSAALMVFAHLSGDAGFRAENCTLEVCTEAR
jgi:hypothetical protein